MKRFIIILIASMLITLSANSQDGASIFKKNCAVCHTIGKGKIVGPDLIGVDKKHDIKWLIKWVKSSQSLVKKNDPKAVQIFNDNNKMIMPDQALTDDEVKAVVAFVSEETTKLEQPPVVSSPPVAIPNETINANQSEKQSSSNFSAVAVLYLSIGINVFLTIIIIGLSNVIKVLAHYNKK